jgi:hypothetical protein
VKLLAFMFVCVLACRAEEVLRVTPCELSKEPARYHHKLVEVTGTVSQGFEDFTLAAPECRQKDLSEVWLEYGGQTTSGVIYCCGNHNSRRGSLTVDGYKTTFVEDKNYRSFKAAVKNSTVEATLQGRFFAKSETVGYGHIGFFHLLVIQRVVAVAPSVK